MYLIDLWLLIRWELGVEGQPQTQYEKVLSALFRLVASTVYWLMVAALLTIIVGRLS